MNVFRLTFILFLFFLAVSIHASAQSSDATEEISGSVKDDAGRPLSSVIVRLVSEEKMGRFAMTDKKGKFKLRIKDDASPTGLRFSKLGYETEIIPLSDKTLVYDVTLSKSASTLKEVTVAAPEVRLRGDTVSFLLSAFAGKGDVSLKDALKKVPGINVAESGEISYNGKSISNFYIEGMDLLGEKYDVATTNIPASYVNAIEVINNHHDKKIDKGLFSDNVALNVRLKKQAMFRPTGTYTLGAGLGNPLPLEASGAGMMFRNDFQSILTLKGTDIEEFSEREQGWLATTTNFENLPDLASSVLPKLYGAGAPLRRVRWIKPIDAATSLNFMNKRNEDISVRTNIDYAFRKAENDYSDTRLYFDGNGDIEIRQTSNPLSESHTPTVSNEYRINKDDFYFENSFIGKATFTVNNLPVTTPSSVITQHQRGNNFNIRDYISWSSFKRKWGLAVTGALEYSASPERKNRISEKGADAKDAHDSQDELHATLLQKAQSHSFFSMVSVSTSSNYKGSHIVMPLKFCYTDESLSTLLSYEGAPSLNGSSNRLSGKTFRAIFSPQYFLRTEYERLTIIAAAPVELKSEKYLNTGTRRLSDSGLRFLIAPDFYLNYSITAKSTLGFDVRYSTTSGDILDFLSSPVMTDYLSGFYKSGIVSKNHTFSTSIFYFFKLPLSMWYANANLSYSRSGSNIQSSQDVSDGLILSGTFLSPSASESINASASVTKNINSIKTKITAGGSYGYSSNRVTQNDIPVKYHSNNTSVSLSLSTNPCRWLEFGYDGSYSDNSSSYLGKRQSFISNNHDINLSIFPIDPLQIKFSADITNREIEKGRFKTSNLFDVYMAYKFNKFRVSLRLRNIFDCRSYSYTIFNGLDRFNYNYSLRGRQLVVKFTFTL